VKTMGKEKNSQLRKNLSNPLLTGNLLHQTILVAKILRQVLWQEDLKDFNGLPELKVATKILEKSIEYVMPNDSEDKDSNQLSLDI
jgi:hypothetical protein